MSIVARPPYFDPVTNIRFDTDCAEFEGWLTKQSAWVKVCLLRDIAVHTLSHGSWCLVCI